MQAIARKSNCHIEDDLIVELVVQSWMGDSSQKWEHLAGPEGLTALQKRQSFEVPCGFRAQEFQTTVLDLSASGSPSLRDVSL